MSNMERKYKREILKRELGTNKINNEFHKRYGYTPNKTKNEIKLFERLKRALRKMAHKKARARKSGK